ncbi:MAG: CRISPR-associated endonuclease Cas1 [Deltaproteobacteria bacterium RIFCSPLOWO2_12_FULL_43_16]|nr:MAG: CRISPR-associated endonuclease Cas1 [Deltaproteobacteria bacterium GWA2_43_19]OGQ11039.1 MAG: CRISPR-associated endonuclease Cas1 [Deltaproteobacteria bacterium RIFCSPHIGHO2_02_FULL_43_33]OGQ57170.1 MAG: CRISPR-associated endonuclease Cas1 [Deltaproteobacteria bacterium RIFCSPLOWO2_12_FULL_43_16]HBR17946.1 CRISPR-associated endonuclease Cas1 [Deltaproteobacteria bacterium]
MTAITDRITLYITADESSISRRGDAFLIQKAGEEKGQKIPAMKVKDIVVVGHVTLDSRLIGLCREESIPIHFLSGRWEYQGSLQFEPVKNLFIRRAQIKKHFDPEKKLDISKKIVGGKIRNQQAMLDKYRKNLKLACPQIDSVGDMETLRGIEGVVAKEYYGFYPAIIKNSEFTFTRRTKRPPEDEINALLSLLYTLIFNEIHSTALLVGLDPAFGYLHDVYYGRPSLICDLLEEWRPLADRFVLNMINRKEVTPEDFRKETDQKGVWLSKDGYPKVIKKWHQFFKMDEQNTSILSRPITYQHAIERQVRTFSQYLMDDKDNYKTIEL